MQLIKNNPYRIIGILVGTSLKEERTKTIKLKQYLDAEKSLPEDFSFPILGEINRNIENVDRASSKLHLNLNRINAAIFWFYDGSHVDEPVFEAMKESNEKALQLVKIWNNLTVSDKVTARNCSAFQNLSTFKLNLIGNSPNINLNNFEKSIKLKLKFLESEFCSTFVKLATDITFKISISDLQHLFLNQLYSEIKENKGISSLKFLEIVSKIPFSAKLGFINNFIQKPIEQLELTVEGSKKKRKNNPELAIEFGNNLFDQSDDFLSQIKAVLGSTNFKYSSISDKVSNEILQCAIEYYNHFFESEIDPGLDALNLGKKAEELAVGDIVKQRCDRTIDIFQEWVDEASLRDTQTIVSDETKFLQERLEEFQSTEDTIFNALVFIDDCKSYLKGIKDELGKDNDLYIKISNSIASNAQSMIISTINESVEKRNSYLYDHDDFITDIKDAWTATNSLGSIDMTTKQRAHYETNKEKLKEIYQEVVGVKVFIRDTPIPWWIFWASGALIALLIIYAIWGSDGILVVVGIVVMVFILFGLGHLENIGND